MYPGDSPYKTARETLMRQGIDAFTAQSHGTGAVIEDQWSQTACRMASLIEAMIYATSWDNDRLLALQSGMDMFVVTQASTETEEALVQYGLDYDEMSNTARAHVFNTETPCIIYRLRARQGPIGFYPSPRELIENIPRNKTVR